MPIVYDVESYPNVFTLAAIGCDSDQSAIFEISPWRDDRAALLHYLAYLRDHRIEMVGFNNLHYDYVLLHNLLSDTAALDPARLQQLTNAIINSRDRFAFQIWESDHIIPQIDLFKIHHFDNVGKATSLKALQINMRSESVEDLPFKPGTVLTADQMPILRQYNMHDATETKKFYWHTIEQIQFRRELSAKYGRSFMNKNDTAVGKSYFVMRLEDAAPGSCYSKNPRAPRQTHRHEIRLADIILPCIRFKHPEFQRIHSWMYDQVITGTKGVFTDVSCTVNGFDFHFGTGGIHGSVARQAVHESESHAILDIDVTSFYPSIPIANRLHPAHLGELFCDIYADVFEQRKQTKKGTAANAMLKLALNGVYGDSNQPYSPFFDPQYTMSITINGQLLICMLTESILLTVPGIELIQVNTDGLTIKVPRKNEWLVMEVCAAWEKVTRLTLEYDHYKSMWIRDVNNYLAENTAGKMKRKGVYETAQPGDRIPVGWHQDCSALVVPKTAEYIMANRDSDNSRFATYDPFDWMLRAKVPRACKLMHGDKQIQNTSRYYIAKRGAPLVKISPPVAGAVPGEFKKSPKASLADYQRSDNTVWNPEIHTKNKSVHADRVTKIQAGWNVAICNRASDFDFANVDTAWYIAEIQKIVIR